MCTVGDPGWRHGSHETACITGPRREVKKTESGREQQPSEVWAFFPGHKFKKSDWWPYLPAPEHLHPSPKAVMATVERLQRGWEHLKPVPRESCRGWAGFGKETCGKWAGFQIIAGSLPGLLALPLLPLPATATLPPVLATSLCWRMIPRIGDPHSDFGLLDYQLYLQETEQLWGVQTLLARDLTAGKQQGQDFNMGPDFRFLVLYCLESRLILYTKSLEIFEYFSLPIGKASELFGSVFL